MKHDHHPHDALAPPSPSLAVAAAVLAPALYAPRRRRAQPWPSTSRSSRSRRRRSRSRPARAIVWTNHDEAPHTVTSSDKSFASKGLDTDDKYEHTFASEGDFNYICTVHPFMTGVVHVR